MKVLLIINILICFLGFILEWKHEETNNLIIRKRTNPINILVSIFCFFTLIILMTANRNGYDAFNFRLMYNYVSEYGTNPWDYSYEAFKNLIKIFLKIFKNATYYEFHAFILICFGLILFRFYRRLTYSFYGLCFLYMISGVYAVDGMQFKNFISMCLMVYALTYLTKEEGNLSKNYFIFITIATLFHFSFVLYFFIPLIQRSGYQKVKRIFPIIGVIIYTFFFVSGTTVTSRIILLLAKLPLMRKLSIYGDITAGIRSIVPVVIYLIALLFLYFCKMEADRLSKNKSKFIIIIWDIWLMMGIVLPFLIYANAAYRIFRNLYIPMFVVMSNNIVVMPRLSRRRLAYSIMVIVFAFILYYYPIALNQAVDIYQPVMEGEFFWIE